MGYTLAEKIIRKNTGKDVHAGELVTVRPACRMVIDSYTSFVYKKYHEMGFKEVYDPDSVVYISDHFIPCCTEVDVSLQDYAEKFITENGIKHFHSSEGICHQLMPQLHYAMPGEIVFVTDSHTTTYGGVTCFSTGVGYTEMGALLGTGELWIKIPESIRIEIDGPIPEGVMSKDVILQVMGDIRADGGTYKSLEFCGSGVSAMSIDARLTIANMAVECGAKVCLFPADEKTAAYTGKPLEEIDWLYGDEDASYARKLYYKGADLVPNAACPWYVDNVHPVTEVEGTPVDQVFIGSCTNGRLEDIAMAARILKGKKIAPFMKLYVTPASRTIFEEAMHRGYITDLIEAGATVLQTGCTVCLGTTCGILSAGQTMLGTHNRNFLGRFGSKNARVYLGSPATAAATALTGVITDPRKLLA